LLCGARREKDQEIFALNRSISNLREELERVEGELLEATKKPYEGNKDDLGSLPSPSSLTDLSESDLDDGEVNMEDDA